MPPQGRVGHSDTGKKNWRNLRREGLIYTTSVQLPFWDGMHEKVCGHNLCGSLRHSCPHSFARTLQRSPRRRWGSVISPLASISFISLKRKSPKRIYGTRRSSSGTSWLKNLGRQPASRLTRRAKRHSRISNLTPVGMIRRFPLARLLYTSKFNCSRTCTCPQQGRHEESFP